MNKSIESGQFSQSRYVFYPYVAGRPVFQNEDELRHYLPIYARKLFSFREELATRPSSGDHWWELTRRREWMDRTEARIVSKYFGGPGAFFADEAGVIAVVQGYAWFPTERLKKASSLLPPGEFSQDFVCAYVAVLNSRVFGRLLQTFAPRVAGGQYNLSGRYVRQIPLPDLAQQVLDNTFVPEIQELDTLGRVNAVNEPKWLSQADELTARVYRIPLEHWK